MDFYPCARLESKKLDSSLKEQIVAADLLDDLIHRYDAPRDLSDDLEPHGYCPSGPGSSEPWEQQVRFFTSCNSRQHRQQPTSTTNLIYPLLSFYRWQWSKVDFASFLPASLIAKAGPRTSFEWACFKKSIARGSH